MKEKLLLWDGVDSPLAKLVYNLLLRYSDIYNYLWEYNYQKGGLFNSFNMAYFRKKSMSCDFRLSCVKKKTLQKRRAITIFDQFRLLGNGLWIQLKMTARRANWRLFKPLKRFLPRFHVMICICMVKNSRWWLDNNCKSVIIWTCLKRSPFSPL